MKGKTIKITEVDNGYIVKEESNWGGSVTCVFENLDSVFEDLLRVFENRIPEGNGLGFGKIKILRGKENE